MARIAPAAVAVALLVAACGDDGDDGGAARTSTTAPGRAADDAAPQRITYSMTGVTGEAVEVGALLAVPRGAPPPGGWPVVAYAHSTTGSAEACAPSTRPRLAGVSPALAGLADAGYVAVATDYEGVGSDDPHPYLHGPSEAVAVVESVRAARAVVDGAGDVWAVVGYSQGGHAAVWTAQLAGELAPELTLVGAASIAGALDPLDLAERGGAGVTALLAAGWLAVDDVDAGEVLTEAGREAVDAVEERCSVGSAGRVVRAERRAAFDDYLRSQRAGRSATVAPVLLLQGGGDELVPPSVARQAEAGLCETDAVVELIEYPDADHGTLPEHAAGDLVAWLSARFDGEPPPSTC